MCWRAIVAVIVALVPQLVCAAGESAPDTNRIPGLVIIRFQHLGIGRTSDDTL
jgi:hypothetical protein